MANSDGEDHSPDLVSSSGFHDSPKAGAPQSNSEKGSSGALNIPIPPGDDGTPTTPEASMWSKLFKKLPGGKKKPDQQNAPHEQSISPRRNHSEPTQNSPENSNHSSNDQDMSGQNSQIPFIPRRPEPAAPGPSPNSGGNEAESHGQPLMQQLLIQRPEQHGQPDPTWERRVMPGSHEAADIYIRTHSSRKGRHSMCDKRLKFFSMIHDCVSAFFSAIVAEAHKIILLIRRSYWYLNTRREILNSTRTLHKKWTLLGFLNFLFILFIAGVSVMTIIPGWKKGFLQDADRFSVSNSTSISKEILKLTR